MSFSFCEHRRPTGARNFAAGVLLDMFRRIVPATSQVAVSRDPQLSALGKKSAATNNADKWGSSLKVTTYSRFFGQGENHIQFRLFQYPQSKTIPKQNPLSPVCSPRFLCFPEGFGFSIFFLFFSLSLSLFLCPGLDLQKIGLQNIVGFHSAGWVR